MLLLSKLVNGTLERSRISIKQVTKWTATQSNKALSTLAKWITYLTTPRGVPSLIGMKEWLQQLGYSVSSYILLYVLQVPNKY